MADPLFTDEQLEEARVLFAQQATFMMGAVKMDGLPAADWPEVCFAGRSNVGKSSLINGLVGHKKLARASNEPGRTREINFFLLGEKLRLVDLPGYGFARVSRSTANKFQDLGRQYLRGRPNLKRVYLLIDARHGLKDVDKEALDALDLSAVSYQIVLTKADKIKPAEAAALVDKTQGQIAKRPAAFPRVLATSAEKGTGLPELRAEIKTVCEV
ncbi:YihA family ribosome biogenesis GTP-binding protein [Caulobacter sp. SLTY]|uniref:ribosome biogenesis GTP-binding protein YihA/YsxC n=1 Tax=Caulobacter sp. SLTY TaxID=2683262 RepID=UPI001411DA66|nr:ribosome biogenesis GTP-binding protein YihA/YsxC [Caulobacter sp. SLTY]NBB14192.1 YihA family ribosome biogenesis GTP-binding protein [Caulobacter sp. SLTY]